MTRMEFERRRRGWTQIDLAYHSRVTNAEISRLERQQATPYPGQAARLAEALGLTPNSLQEELSAPADGREGRTLQR